MLCQRTVMSSRNGVTLDCDDDHPSTVAMASERSTWPSELDSNRFKRSIVARWERVAHNSTSPATNPETATVPMRSAIEVDLSRLDHTSAPNERNVPRHPSRSTLRRPAGLQGEARRPSSWPRRRRQSGLSERGGGFSAFSAGSDFGAGTSPSGGMAALLPPPQPLDAKQGTQSASTQTTWRQIRMGFPPEWE